VALAVVAAAAAGFAVDEEASGNKCQLLIPNLKKNIRIRL
jgi:hypothetical protein